MKLWEKNYVLTMCMIMVILYGSIFIILSSSFQMNLKGICNQEIQNEKNIRYALQSLFNEDTEHTKVKIYCGTLESEGTFIAMYDGQEEIVNFLPFQAAGENDQSIQIVKMGAHRYLYIIDSFEYQEEQEIYLCYMGMVDEVYRNHQKQVVVMLLISALITILIAGILYYAMKKIYHPINNIAHELRTPLTSIQGYAQYILYGNIKEEDIQYAGARINDEARYINEVIERILIMENIKSGEIHMEKIELQDMWETIKKHYPSIVVEGDMKYIMGDRTLLQSLFLNLLSNISRSGNEIVITASEGEIRIQNRADFIDQEMLDILNGNRRIPKERIQGKGFGVSLCREIVGLHNAKLRYTSSKDDGTVVTVLF